MNNVVKLHSRPESPEGRFDTVIEVLRKNGNTRLVEVLKKEKKETPPDIFSEILKVIEHYLQIMRGNNFPRAVRSILGENQISSKLSANDDTFGQPDKKVA